MAALSHIIALLVIVSLTSSSVVKSPADGDNFELLILHDNDMHARFDQTSQLSGVCTTADSEAGKCYGGFARVAHVVKKARADAASGEGPPVLYLNAGDTYTGTAWFTIYKWKIAAEFINALQPDAICLGNHEFDEDIDGLVPFIRNVSAPVLAANLILTEVPELRNESNLYNSTIITKNNVKIGIIGYVTPDTKFLAPKNKVNYEEEIISIKREVKKLKNQEVKILIALGHSGYLKDLDIAREVDDIDIVIGGHSNTFLTNRNNTEIPEIQQGPYPTMVKQNSGRLVPVVQAYAYTKYIGKLHVTFSSEGEIMQWDGEPVLLDQNVPRDPDLQKMIVNYSTDAERVNNEIVGSSLDFLDGNSCRIRECNIGNLIADAMIYYVNEKFYKDNSNLTIAIIQGGRIRSSINRAEKPFNMTRNDWMTVLPYSDPLTIVSMNGTILRQALEHSVEMWRAIDSVGGFLQYSGIKIVYDLARAPGSRVVKALTICSNCKESSLADIQDVYEYNVLMPTFLANGGDDYVVFNELPRKDLHFNEIVCVYDYLKKYSPVSPKLSERITIINEDKINNDVKITLTMPLRNQTKPSKASIYTPLKIYYIMAILLKYILI